MKQWHCHINGQKYGPVDEPTLKQWIAQGRLGKDDLVWSEGMPLWQPASQIADLSLAASTPGAAPCATPAGIPAVGGCLAPHRGVMILVFGILSFVCCFIFGICAWTMGNADLREMAAGRMDRSGEGLTNAGRICGIIGTIMACVGLFFQIIIVLINVIAH